MHKNDEDHDTHIKHDKEYIIAGSFFGFAGILVIISIFLGTLT